MATKPSDYPKWASLDQTDPVSGQNNVLTPPPQKQLYGWDRLEFPPRNWFNWLGRLTYEWITWFDQQESQSVTVQQPNAGTQTIFEMVNGGMAILKVVDTDAANANAWLDAILYIPPASSLPAYPLAMNIMTHGGTTDITAASIDSAGVVTITGGTGPFIVYGQMKTA